MNRILSGRRGLAVILLFATLVRIYALARTQGYPMADPVEYVDKAWWFVEGVHQGPETIRPFFYSLVFLPVFALGHLFGVADWRFVVLPFRVLIAALSIGCIGITHGIGKRLGGEPAGIVAALLLACHPVFAQWSTNTVSEIPTTFFALLAVRALLPPDASSRELSARSVLAGGAFLSLAILIKYQSLILVPILGLWILFLRRRLRNVALLAAAGAAGIVVLGLADWIGYGRFLCSLQNYLALQIPHYVASAARMPAAIGDPALAGTQQPVGWYFTHAFSWITPWDAPLAALGVAAAFAWRSRRVGLVAALAIGSLYFLTVRNNKELRLLTTTLPFLSLLAGLGFSLAWHKLWPRLVVTLPFLAGVALACVGLLGQLRAVDWSPYRGFAEAARFCNDRIPEPTRTAVSLPWAVRFLHAARHKVEQDFPQSSVRPGEVERMLSILEASDVWIVHRPLLEALPRVFETTNRLFEVRAVFGDRTPGGPGEVYLLTRREAPGGRRLVRTGSDLPPAGEGREVRLDNRITFTGFALETLDNGVPWIRYGWRCVRPVRESYVAAVHFREPSGEANVFQADHRPFYGTLPTDRWTPGTAYEEGYPLLPPPEARGRTLPLWIGMYLEGSPEDALGVLRVSNPLDFPEVRGGMVEAGEARIPE